MGRELKPTKFYDPEKFLRSTHINELTCPKPRTRRTIEQVETDIRKAAGKKNNMHLDDWNKLNAGRLLQGGIVNYSDGVRLLTRNIPAGLQASKPEPAAVNLRTGNNTLFITDPEFYTIVKRAKVMSRESYDRRCGDLFGDTIILDIRPALGELRCYGFGEPGEVYQETLEIGQQYGMDNAIIGLDISLLEPCLGQWPIVFKYSSEELAAVKLGFPEFNVYMMPKRDKGEYKLAIKETEPRETVAA